MIIGRYKIHGRLQRCERFNRMKVIILAEICSSLNIFSVRNMTKGERDVQQRALLSWGNTMMAGRNSQAVGGRMWASQARVLTDIETELR